jgi:hypothetical protein
MQEVKITTDFDTTGFSLPVEPLAGGGYAAIEPGFNGIQPGQLTKTYVDGVVHWAQRRKNRLVFLPDTSGKYAN